MDMFGNPVRIVWAVDAFSEENRPQKRVADFLRKWMGRQEVNIEPVSVVSPDQLSLSEHLFLERLNDIKGLVEYRLGKWMKHLKLKKLMKPTVLVSDHPSLRSEAQTLVAYAKEIGAHLIALNSHSRQGLSRFVLGSFAETLILQSDIPVLIVKPGIKVPSAYKRFFFPTDLSEYSYSALREILPVVKNHSGKLILFHQMDPLTDLVALGMSSPYLYEDHFLEELSHRENKLNAMAKLARQEGVRTEIVLSDEPGKLIEKMLNTARKSKTDIIAVTSESGPVATALLGSVARKIVREASCPVWVVHPRASQKTQKNVIKERPSHEKRNAII